MPILKLNEYQTKIKFLFFKKSGWRAFIKEEIDILSKVEWTPFSLL